MFQSRNPRSLLFLTALFKAYGNEPPQFPGANPHLTLDIVLSQIPPLFLALLLECFRSDVKLLEEKLAEI